MNPATDILSPDNLDMLADALGQCGYLILPEALDQTLVQSLFKHADSMCEQFMPAGTGREAQHRLDHATRRDSIHWLDNNNPVEQQYLVFAEELRRGLNERLYLGLFDYECHFARYDNGGFYKRHLDAFAGQRNRVLSTVLYLNSGWQKEDAGELLLYGDSGQIIETVLPESNTLVIFFSERFPHEVLPATRRRLSVAGWFRLNRPV